jgi:hypothetical protein
MGRKLNPEAKARLDAAMVVAYGDVATLTVPCVWCGRTLDMVAGEVERDRVRPGGAYTLDNVAPACRPCNADRGDATGGEWDDAHRAHPVRAMVGAPEVARALRAARGARRAADHAAAATRSARVREGG